MSKHEQERLFAKWLEEELNSDEQERFAKWCREDESFAKRVSVVEKMEALSNDFQMQNPPEWNREATFESSRSEKVSWWQWQPSLSLAMSFAAILMVLFKVEISTTDAGMTISFAGAQQEQQIQNMLDERLDDFAASQATYLADRTEQMQQQQMDMNTQLANYLLSTSRTERREDFAEFIKFVNQQRNDDQVYYARQLNSLQRDLVTNIDSPE
ncbi:MAG: hypothetical protein ACFHVJ_00345 [Aestuariibacter sp.]